ncbi:MAG: BamA/TamA family outer membrane protein [Bdellovibrionaceae bacterium]|nr:BamA/TamA family outer membrane protein [Pseudobdellovibrionaceae bacterium]
MRLVSLIASSALLLSSSFATARTVILSDLPQSLQALLLKDDPQLATRSVSLDEVDQKLRFLQGNPAVEKAFAVINGGDNIRLQVRTAKRIGEVQVEGLKVLSKSAALEALSFEPGERYHTDLLTEAAERLRVAYLGRGVRSPIIDVETPETQPGIVDLNFKVTEGLVTQIRQWQVRSRNTDLAARLEKRLNDRLKGPYTEDRLSSAQDVIRKELRTGRHFQAEVLSPQVQFTADESSATVTLRVERAESYVVDFRGNRSLSRSLLEDDILNLKSFVTSNPNVGNEMAEKIRQAYLQRGYARVTVSIEELDGYKPSQRRLVFTIDEGPRVRIEKYEIKGRISRAPAYYTDLLREHSSDLVAKGFYNKADLEKGFENLALELQNEGYLIAKILSTRTEYNRERTQITVHVNVDEGPLTLVEGIEFEGNDTVSSQELRDRIGLKTGEALRLNQIDEAINAVKSEYWGRGYIEMQLLNEGADLVVYNEDNTKAKLAFKIQEGPQVRVASILLDGNTFTRDFVLLNELDFEEGDLLTPANIGESIARLQKTGYFGIVEIKTLEEKTAVANRTVIVRVTERNPGVFTIGAGATNENELTLRGYTGIAYRNLFGTGRGVSLRVEANYNIAKLKYFENRVIAGYVEPYLFNTRNRGRINVSRSNIIVDYELTKIQELIQWTYSVERDFTSHITGIWDLWSLGSYRDSFLDESKGQSSQLEIASTIWRLDFDYRNNPFNPTGGHLTKFTAEYSSPDLRSKNVDEFWRATGGFTYYWDVMNTGWVWVNALRGGYLESMDHGANGGVPYDKVGFILGGRSTLRGFEAGTSDVFPNNEDLGNTDSYKLSTSARMSLIKSELRFPLWIENLGGSVFYDGGSVEITNLKLPDTYRDSAGFGFYYVTPVGPLNVEFAWKLDQRPKESPWRFHLSIGSF